MTKITTMVWSFTYSQTSCSVRSSGFSKFITMNKARGGDGNQLSYFKS